MFNFMMNGGTATRLSPQDIVAKAKAGAMTVVDVRDHNELMMSGKAKDAIHIPLAVIRMQVDPKSPDFNPALDLDTPVAVYCASGARSSMAVQVFQSMGFKEVHNLGGLGHWYQAGGEIERA